MAETVDGINADMGTFNAHATHMVSGTATP